MITYGPWRPDAFGPDKPYVERAEGCVPQAGATGFGYGPYPASVVAPGAVGLDDAPRGGISLQLFDGSWAVFFATETELFQLQSDYSWLSIESGRTVQPDDDVSFCHFGAYLLNTDILDGMKAYDVETGGTNTAISGAPAARVVFSCNNVLFALDCDGNNRRMRSSDIGRHDRWSGGAADGKVFEDGGALICGADLKNGAAIILQESCARLIQFGVGAGAYSIAKIADGRGAVSARSLASFDGTAFWWDTDGPWMFSLASGLVPIGAGKINEWAEESIGPANYRDLQATVDPARNLVLWRVDNSRCLVYNWFLKEWSVLPVSTTALARLATPAVSIDSVSTPIDDVSEPIDSRIWAGSAPLLGSLDSNRRFSTFSGASMAATIETARVTAPVSRLFNWATPVDDAGGTLALGVADRLDLPLTWKPGNSRTASGRVPCRARGKISAWRRVIPAGDPWTYANGVDGVVATAGGPR